MKARIPGAQQGGSANMMKKIQEMQEEMARVQQEVEETEFSASAGGGAVEVTVNGRHEAVSIKMAPEIIDPEEPEMLEDLIMAATNEALRQIDEQSQASMSKITGGLGGGLW